MTDYISFFLDSGPDVYRIETLEISHPDFSQTYRVQHADPQGVTLGGQAHQYVPMRIAPRTASNDLSAGLSITFGDLGTILPLEMDRVAAASGLETKPTVNYSVFRSDDLTAPMYGPDTFELSTISFERDGASFDAQARSLDLNRTGERYNTTRFPMLSGFLT